MNSYKWNLLKTKKNALEYNNTKRIFSIEKLSCLFMNDFIENEKKKSKGKYILYIEW